MFCFHLYDGKFFAAPCRQGGEGNKTGTGLVVRASPGLLDIPENDVFLTYYGGARVV